MKKWNIPPSGQNQKHPIDILQEFADALHIDSNQKLTGQVTEQISYDSEDRPKLFYALHVYVNKLRQSYRLFEIEQITENVYPVNLKVILYSGTENYDNISTPKSLEVKLSELSNNLMVGNLLAHFIRLSELKEE